MLTLGRMTLAFLLAALSLALVSAPAFADCESVNESTGQCEITVTDPGSGGGTKPIGGGKETGGSCQADDGSEIPCATGGMVWTGSCYAQPVPPEVVPEDERAAHEGDTGTWYSCATPGGGLDFFFYDTSPPNPVDLARQAIETMTLKAIPIGIVPEDRPGKVGIVGMPVWMWSKSRSASVVGPITKSASVGAYTVTATARLARVVWTMGDGKTVVCAGSNAMGTEYEDRFDTQSSPTCGHRYNRPGRYEVRATSHWEVEWSGIGQTGTITLELYDTTDIRVSEVQVLTQ